MPRKAKAKTSHKRKRGTRKSSFQVTFRKHRTPETNNVTFWMALVVLVVSNFAISIVLIPFLIILEKIPLYSILCLIGFMFGSLFKLTLDSIGNLENRHEYIAQFFIPSLAIINIAVITTISNKIDEILQLNIMHDPVVIGLLYAFAFILPFIYQRIIEKIKTVL